MIFTWYVAAKWGKSKGRPLLSYQCCRRPTFWRRFSVPSSGFADHKLWIEIVSPSAEAIIEGCRSVSGSAGVIFAVSPSARPEGLKMTLLDADGSNLRALLDEFEDAVLEKVAERLPPKCDADHAVSVTPETWPPHRPLYQLSPAKLVPAREYADKHLHSGKKWPSNSSHGYLIFLSKSQDESCAVLPAVVSWIEQTCGIMPLYHVVMKYFIVCVKPGIFPSSTSRPVFIKFSWVFLKLKRRLSTAGTDISSIW